MSKPLYLHYSLKDDGFFDADTGAIISAIRLARNDSSLLRVQAVLNRGASISQTTYQASTRTIDLSSYTGTPIFGLKTAALRDADGDYSESWSGYTTGDSGWHSLANGRATMTVAPSITPATYAAEFQLLTGASAAMSLPGRNFFAELVRDVAIGSEATAPAGATLNYGSGTILEGNSSVDVAVTGLTTATGAAVVGLKNSADFTPVSYSIPANGTLRLHSSAAAPSGGWVVSYLVTHL